MKSAVQRNDLSPAIVDEVAELVRLPERSEEGSARQNNLKVARLTDLEADMDKPVSKFEFGRRFDVENGVKISGRHSTPRGHATTEPSLCAVSNLNVNLQQLLTRGFTKTKFRRPEFVQLIANANGLIPLFRLPRFNSPERDTREARSSTRCASRLISDRGH
jgi:hypothetical protein